MLVAGLAVRPDDAVDRLRVGKVEVGGDAAEVPGTAVVEDF